MSKYIKTDHSLTVYFFGAPKEYLSKVINFLIDGFQLAEVPIRNKSFSHGYELRFVDFSGDHGQIHEYEYFLKDGLLDTETRRAPKGQVPSTGGCVFVGFLFCEL